MVSSTSSAYNLTVANSASPSYTLKVMTVVAVVFFPVVLAYQGWSLWVFRKRLAGPPVGPGGGPTPDGPPAGRDPASPELSSDPAPPDLATLGTATAAAVAGAGGDPPAGG